MRQIILASRSPQRIQLLKDIGLRFKVAKSTAREKRKTTSSVSNLVKENALAKARDVARRHKKGIVIGCDTVVLVGKHKIIGKPKNLNEAKRMLRFLSKRPQWVYSGIAVIDIDKKKTLVDYEKTKVYMDALTDREIARYFSKVSPLDKAGSFDIQNQGSLFIRRIEGCFYNVVGLPLSKLYKLFKKLGVSILAVLMMLQLCGCMTEYNVATQREDVFFYSTDREVNLGKSVSKAFEKEYELSEDVSLQKKVAKIGKDIVAVCDRKAIDYYFKVVEEDEINAVSLPGGYVYIFKGLIDELENDDELAGVIAHEVGHIVARHSIKKLQAALGMTLLSLVTISTTSPEFARGANAAISSVFLEYSKEDEFLADELSIKYCKLAGYNPEGVVTLLEKLLKNREIRPFSYWRTHPYVSERMAYARQAIYGRMGFRDYINIEADR
ncbi:Maf family nucleotide pyrophosphatase [Candidatus Omnitrophota bacterium]